MFQATTEPAPAGAFDNSPTGTAGRDSRTRESRQGRLNGSTSAVPAGTILVLLVYRQFLPDSSQPRLPALIRSFPSVFRRSIQQNSVPNPEGCSGVAHGCSRKPLLLKNLTLAAALL